MTLLSEKYRPKDFVEVLGNSEIIEILKNTAETKNTPHLLFTGSPGTGKTTCAWILSKKIINNEDGILELNASDDRGIDVVRTTIKNFSQRVINNIPFKFVILDEADSMTNAAQQAMRRTMETNSTVRFILICNSLTKIFEPIQSRCAILKFEKISNLQMTNRLKEIILNESIKISEDAINMIVNLADGDMRQALNILQCSINADFINEKVILKVTGQPSPTIVDRILNNICNNDIEQALLDFDMMWDEKYDPADIVNAFFRVAKNKNDLETLKCIGPLQIRITEGVASKLQFYGMFYELLKIKG
ncbi:Replication factor C subunit 4 [Dictyocoela muelleri]|nr:Replication factor C subunit 4 [Dictyocoela muelleri]